jgi:sarcosine oxidase subunit gamma
MKSSQALSPVHDALVALSPVWRHTGATPAVVSAFNKNDADRAAILGIADYSHLPRVGAKGPGAAAWLAGFSLQLPAQANSWKAIPNGGLIARLGRSEYLIEANSSMVDAIMLASRTSGVYPVLRQDATFALCGSRVNELLLQTCNVDFRILTADPTRVVLTSMAGVGVTILLTQIGSTSCYRLWCDGTYGIYLWQILNEIAQELGGGCVGLDALQ